MDRLNSETWKRLEAIAKQHITVADSFQITPWINVLPVWKFISKQPLLRSILVSMAMFFILLVSNYDMLTPKFLAKLFFLLAEVFVGFYSMYYFARKANEMYHHLSRITLLPRDTFRRWFAEKISKVFGKINMTKGPRSFTGASIAIFSAR